VREWTRSHHSRIRGSGVVHASPRCRRSCAISQGAKLTLSDRVKRWSSRSSLGRRR